MVFATAFGMVAIDREKKTRMKKKVLLSIGSNTFRTIMCWKFAKKILDPILTNTLLFGTG